MKKIFITICKIILGLLLIITIIYSLPNHIDELFYVKAMTHHILTEIRDTIIVGVNNNKNSKALNEYLKENYGDIIYNVVEIKENHRYGSEMVYNIKMPFMDNMFFVFINNGEITQVNFYDKVFYDPKFQHLYSEWVKKQVGIDDENVELYFNRASCGSRNIGDNVYIDFDKITALDNLEEDICKNTHNLYIRSNHYEQGVDVKINNIDNIKEVLNYADLIEKKIKPRVFIDTNHFMPSENNHLFIYLLSENTNKHLMTIMYDYDENVKKYYYVSNDRDWIKYE